MSLSSYKVFDAVAKKKSLARAAEELNLTPSAVSHSLMKLESELGFQLMERDRNGVRLTSYGELLLPQIRSILQSEYKLQEEVDMLNGLEKGIVNIGAFNSVCSNWLPDIIKEFGQKYPGIEIRIFQGGYKDMRDWLESSKVDIAFVSIETMLESPSVTPLIKDPVLCVTPKSFKTRKPGFVTIKELIDKPFIYPEEGYNRDTNTFIRENKLKVNLHHNIRDDMSLMALVESGLGFCLVPKLLLTRVKADIQALEIETHPYRMLGLATPDEKFLTTATKVMIKEIMDYIKTTYPDTLIESE
jgi:DNA-binding transcriptional LysR family regulator